MDWVKRRGEEFVFGRLEMYARQCANGMEKSINCPKYYLLLQTIGEVAADLGILSYFAQWSIKAPSLILCVFDVLIPESAACLPNESIHALSPWSNPEIRSYLGRFLNSSYRSLRLRSILIFFMHPSSGLRSTLSAGTNSLWCVLNVLMFEFLTCPLHFQTSETSTTFSALPFEKRDPKRLIVGEPMSICSLVPMPNDNSIKSQ